MGHEDLRQQRMSADTNWTRCALRLSLTWLCVIAVLIPGCQASGQSMDARKWLEDLEVLARELPRRHVAPATERSLDAFRADVERLRSRVPSMSREAIVVEFARLAASFGDSHTELSLAQEKLGFRRFPIGLYFFDDDLRVIVVDRGHEELLGTRLVAVGERPVADVFDRIRPIIGDDFGNPYEMRHSGPSLIMIPELLVGLELATPGQPIAYVFETDTGHRLTRSFTAVPFQQAAQSMTVRIVVSANEPLFMQRRDSWYDVERVDASDLLYVRVTHSRNQSGRESLAALSDRVATMAAGPEVKRVVVDIRQNTGGNFHTTEPLVRAVCEAAKSGDIAQVYVILGRHTYSAAIVLAAQLKHGCDALFVGETPRAVPNRQADVKRFRLPNSRLVITYSARLRQPFPELANATEVPLDLPAPPTWPDYRAGRDPALEAVLMSRKE